MNQPPKNAYQPGTQLTVGSHKISIIKYISAGGFAHVYTCNIEPAFNGSKVACLKRVVVPSKWQLSLLRQEVDAMRRLRGNKHIVSYIDSHASRLGNDEVQQQYEVLLLMEYCQNNGLIDFMNTRLRNKLTEKEIIDIMYQITIGVAMCHHLRPPLIHRDIKIENVLIDSNHIYKLCDFGSSVNYMPAPKNPQELQLMRDDLMQHTTPQYRAPEMIDLTKGFPIDDKSDIWALGIFLYKLCYYTTPFESNSLQEMERNILNCSETLRFKEQPGSIFSRRLKNIIKVCLRADPRRRPNALQLLSEISQMRGDERPPNVIPYSVTSQPAPTPGFGSIDKSKSSSNITNTTIKSSPFESEPKPSRPVSAYFDHGVNKIYSQGNKSSPTVQAYVKQELAKGYESTDVGDTENTLDFLKSRDSTHDNGIKSAWNSLRKISTGNSSISANSTGESMKKNIKKLLTGSKEEKENSIQRRMQLLMEQQQQNFKKTAHGYGKFTDKNVIDDIDSINARPANRNKKTSPPPNTKPKNSTSSSTNHKVKHTASQHKKLSPPKVPVNLSSKKKPPPPVKPKPKSLQSRRLSTGSGDFTIPDIDDLEKSFQKRFPNYV
ncbi:uncharacterized protein KGF55_002324 [Candida pseudojiufengensis]|uniref:uncharacterized protein n=1 Tax=Candida pseudojiufengensis TaxID=497109 RepID=UPI0022258915|nr:uncharacterized protein KGF55_002324 [Candida pseudojiufengensis]KAI5963444.1 hypothetical protein KGF55_002324 [Candida pseudojiufengensis]